VHADDNPPVTIGKESTYEGGLRRGWLHGKGVRKYHFLQILCMDERGSWYFSTRQGPFHFAWYQNNQELRSLDVNFDQGVPAKTGRSVQCNGNVIVGDLAPGLNFTGHAVSTHQTSGIVYDGQFRNNVYDGHGVVSSPNGLICHGEWKANLRDGPSVTIWKNGTKLDGPWVKNRRSGRTVYTTPLGDVVDGQFEQDNPESREGNCDVVVQSHDGRGTGGGRVQCRYEIVAEFGGLNLVDGTTGKVLYKVGAFTAEEARLLEEQNAKNLVSKPAVTVSVPSAVAPVSNPSTTATNNSAFSLREWLRSFDMEEYCSKFEVMGFDKKTTLSFLTEKDLNEIGIEKRGHVRLFFSKIGELANSNNNSNAAPSLSSAKPHDANPEVD